MNKEMLEWWVSAVAQTTQANKNDTEGIVQKHYELCSLQETMHGELGAVLDACVPVAQATDRGARWLFENFQNDGNGAVEKRVIKFITKYRAELEVWEQEDETVAAARCSRLEKYDDATKQDWQEIAEGLSSTGYCSEIRGAESPDPERIYYKNGAYRRYWRLKHTAEYRVLRALQPHSASVEDLAVLYMAVWLYVAVLNERAFVEGTAAARGVQLPENALKLPYNEKNAHGRGIVHLQQEMTAEGKLERFLKYVPADNKKNARRLLQRVIKAGYCTANYGWVASNWRKGKSRLALAYFAYLASKYLEMSTRECNGEPATNWKPFEMLFDYDGKEKGRNKLCSTKTCYMKGKEKFEPKEVYKIKLLFP